MIIDLTGHTAVVTGSTAGIGRVFPKGHIVDVAADLSTPEGDSENCQTTVFAVPLAERVSDKL